MARRMSKRFVAAEGQISLFAMDDPTMYEKQAEKPAEIEETQQRLPLDFGAQLESYVSQTGGDEAARKDDSEEEAHVSAEEPVQGRKGSPLFLLELLERDHDALDSANRQRELEKGSDIVRISVNGVSAQNRANAIEMIQTAAHDCPIGPIRAIGEFRGLEVVVKKEQTLQERGGSFRYDPFIGLRVKGETDAHWSRHMLPSATSGSHTVLQQMDGIIEKEASGLDQARALMERADKQLEDARKIAAEPWDGEDNLANLKAELAELEQKELEKGRDESNEGSAQDENDSAFTETSNFDEGNDEDGHSLGGWHGI